MPKRSSTIAALALLFSSSNLFAQGLATISGAATDAQGAAITGASVTAVDAATGVRTAVKTNDSGFYSIPNLPVGSYTVTVEHAGFRRYVHEKVNLSTGEVLGLDVRLEVGAVSETLNVTAEAPLVESRTSDVTQLIESKSISDLGLGDRRTMNALALVSGAVFNGYDSGQKPNFSLAGGRTQSQQFWIDGGTGENMRMGIGQMDLDPPIEAVEEIKVLVNSYSAEYGGSAGGVIVETTKSGTNQFRGSSVRVFPQQRDGCSRLLRADRERRQGLAGAPIERIRRHAGWPDPPQQDLLLFRLSRTASPRRRRANRNRPDAAAAHRRFLAGLKRRKGGSDLRSGLHLDSRTASPPARSFRATSSRPAASIRPASKRSPSTRCPTSPSIPSKATSSTASTPSFWKARWTTISTTATSSPGRYIYDIEDTTTTSTFPDPAADPNTFLPAHEHVFHAAWTRVLGPTKVNNLRWEFSDRLSHAESHGLGQNYAGKIGIPNLPANSFPNFQPSGLYRDGRHQPGAPPVPDFPESNCG